MKRFAAIALLSFITVPLFAQIDSSGGAQADMIKRRAKALQGATPAAPPAAPAPGAAPAQPVPAGPRAIDPAQQQLVDKLQSDLSAIKAGSPATAEQKQGLESDFTNLAKGASKPSKESLTKLAGDLSTALAGKDVTLKSQPQLAKALNVVMNNGNISAVQAQTFVTAVQNILKASGVPEADMTAVTTDLKAIITELQKGKSHLYQ